MKRASPSWRNYAGRMGLHVLHVILPQSHGDKLEGGWFALPAVIKHLLLAERSWRKLVLHLRHG